jgi:hypothetical protein
MAPRVLSSAGATKAGIAADGPVVPSEAGDAIMLQGDRKSFSMANLKETYEFGFCYWSEQYKYGTVTKPDMFPSAERSTSCLLFSINISGEAPFLGSYQDLCH